MKIVFVKKVSQKILAARYENDYLQGKDRKEIDYVLLTEKEAKSLCKENILPEFAHWTHVHGCSLYGLSLRVES